MMMIITTWPVILLHHNTDDDYREFRYYHYMALIRALEELLRDLT